MAQDLTKPPGESIAEWTEIFVALTFLLTVALPSLRVAVSSPAQLGVHVVSGVARLGAHVVHPCMSSRIAVMHVLRRLLVGMVTVIISHVRFSNAVTLRG